MAPLSADSHWSHAEPGQAFTFTLEYDSKIYTEPTTRVVRMRRNAETGFSFSEEPEWSYTATKASDSFYHVGISTPHSYIWRFHGGYVAVTRPENFPGALRAPDNQPTPSVSPRAISKFPCRRRNSYTISSTALQPRSVRPPVVRLRDL